MDFGLSEEQQLLQNSIRDLIKKEAPISLARRLDEQDQWFHPPLWKLMADSGWLGLGFSEQYGGAGGDAIEQGVLAAELGRAIATTAYFSTIVPCAWLIARTGTEEQKRRLLMEVLSGRRRLALALAEPDSLPGPEHVQAVAESSGNGFLLAGTKVLVYGGDGVDTFLWAARHTVKGTPPALGVFTVDATAPGVSVQPIPTLVPEGQVAVSLAGVQVPRDSLLGGPGDIGPELEGALDRAVLLRGAAAVETARVAFEMAVEYAKVRVQFGRPIGSFQAIQHRLANACLEVEAAWGVLWEALWTLSAGEKSPLVREIAKAATIQAMERVAEETQVVHGGIGFLRSYDLHLFTRRMLATTPYIGTLNTSREAVAAAMGL